MAILVFKIGDKVVYPMHGAGIIEGMEEKCILGEEHKYYVLKMPIGDMKVMIPVNNIEGIGVRNIVSAEEADKVLKIFSSCGEDENSNWNKRYRENMEKMRIGNLSEIACVTKTLMLRDNRKSLSNAERKMLTNAKNILLSELVLAKNISYTEAEDLLQNAMAEAK